MVVMAGLFTNSFCKNTIQLGDRYVRLLDNVLQEMFRPNEEHAHSPSVHVLITSCGCFQVLQHLI